MTLIARAAEHRGGDRSRSDAYEQHVISPTRLNTVLQRG
jgi:hypothetical protein